MDFIGLKNKRIFIFFCVAFFCVAAAALFYWVRSKPVVGEEAVAVGLRGTSRVDKTLSERQKDKLGEHFLSEPPVAHAVSNHPHADIGAINEFNREQQK